MEEIVEVIRSESGQVMVSGESYPHYYDREGVPKQQLAMHNFTCQIEAPNTDNLVPKLVDYELPDEAVILKYVDEKINFIKGTLTNTRRNLIDELCEIEFKEKVFREGIEKVKGDLIRFKKTWKEELNREWKLLENSIKYQVICMVRTLWIEVGRGADANPREWAHSDHTSNSTCSEEDKTSEGCRDNDQFSRSGYQPEHDIPLAHDRTEENDISFVWNESTKLFDKARGDITAKALKNGIDEFERCVDWNFRRLQGKTAHLMKMVDGGEIRALTREMGVLEDQLFSEMNRKFNVARNEVMRRLESFAIRLINILLPMETNSVTLPQNGRPISEIETPGEGGNSRMRPFSSCEPESGSEGDEMPEREKSKKTNNIFTSPFRKFKSNL